MLVIIQASTLPGEEVITRGRLFGIGSKQGFELTVVELGFQAQGLAHPHHGIGFGV